MSVEILTAARPLDQEYRPHTWDEILGQEVQIKSLRANLASPSRSHCIILTGPSGVGKTTTARIVAADLGCDPGCLEELDAGRSGGVDAIRALTVRMESMPLAGDVKVAIIDECHKLSKDSWTALLKAAEEPPAHAYYFFCTTDTPKLPPTMVTRSCIYEFKAVPKKLIRERLDLICSGEGFELSDEIKDLITDSAGGSPRQAINYLSKARVAQTLDEARELIISYDRDDKSPVIQLARMLIEPCLDWNKYKRVLKEIDEQELAGQVKPVVSNYVGKAFINFDAERATGVAPVLDALSQMSWDGKMADVCLLIQRVLHS